MSGIFPADRARLDDQSHLASFTVTVTSIPGGLTLGNSAAPVFNLPATLTGAYWINADERAGRVDWVVSARNTADRL